MPIHDVGYRRWSLASSNAWTRWMVIAGAGMRLVWKNHWLRRMLFFAWLPAAIVGIGIFCLRARDRATGIAHVAGAAGLAGNAPLSPRRP